MAELTRDEALAIADHARRFWRSVDQSDPRGCWTWIAGLNQKGYGQFKPTNTKSVRAHRWAYEQLVGPIPGDLTLDHLCRNRACVKPAHLEPVTAGENSLRGNGPTAINARKTHCPKGHPYDAANTYVDKRGRRACRTCRRVRQTKAARIARGSGNGDSRQET